MDQSEIAKIQSGLKLSIALRIGARMRPQIKGFYFDGFGTCALGAIAEARGWQPEPVVDDDHIDGLSQYLPELNDIFFSDTASTMGQIIATWNDQGLTREEIADRRIHTGCCAAVIIHTQTKQARPAVLRVGAGDPDMRNRAGTLQDRKSVV